jgi:glycosyltransferase involved in cell wall biosynthesis
VLKILHIAPMNYAGVPFSFYQMHLHCGDKSRIITLHKNPSGFPEDICLELPLPNFKLAKFWRRKKVIIREEEAVTTAPFFKPKNIFEQIYFNINDLFRESTVKQLIEKYNLDEYEIIHFDAGLDFFRNSAQAKRWKKQGKKIICCYYGSDLRTRGIIKEMDELSDLNITSEYDHLALKKDLEYIFYPYDPSELPEKKKDGSDKVKIVHSPTNRKYKGTDLIISVIERIKKEKNIEFVLLENLPRSKVLEIKSGCDICIDQVGGTMGGTGYGKAGIETLGMGIPTITNMTTDYRNWLPENPFIVANNADELYTSLNEIINSRELRDIKGQEGKNWVNKYTIMKMLKKDYMNYIKLMELFSK